MSTSKLVAVGIAIASLFAASCGKRMPNRFNSLGESVKSYDIPTFLKLPTFQGKVLEKYIDFPSVSAGGTNYHVIVFLQKSNGEKVAVTQDHASQDILRIVNGLETNHSYAFPDVLTSTNSELRLRLYLRSRLWVGWAGGNSAGVKAYADNVVINYHCEICRCRFGYYPIP